MKILVLGNNSLIKTLAQNGYQVTTDPGDEVTAIISDAISYKFAPEGPLFIFLSGSICDWTAKKECPEATFITSEQELLEKLKTITVKEPEEYKELPKESLLILTYANKGGVGKTSSAISLASVIAEAGIRTALCDFDFGGPDIGNFFGLKSAPNWLDSNPSLVKASKNLMVLPGPKNVDIYSIKGHQLVSVVQKLQEEYSVVICDTCPAPWEKAYMHEVFANADLVYSVVDQSVFSLQETAKYAPSLLAMGVTPEKIRILINKYNAKLTNSKKIEKAFCSGFKKEVRNLPKIVATIPEGWEDQVKAGFKSEILHKKEWQLAAKEIMESFNVQGIQEEEQGFVKSLFKKIKKAN